jgi:hydrogenase maturation factor HypF (carbamoyltransferase family)
VKEEGGAGGEFLMDGRGCGNGKKIWRKEILIITNRARQREFMNMEEREGVDT